jgi:phenylpropionate dioxygenase-like ring-hydroxylating dioxygenase large terminal subunit
VSNDPEDRSSLPIRSSPPGRPSHRAASDAPGRRSDSPPPPARPRPGLSHGAAAVQSLLDEDTRNVPDALRDAELAHVGRGGLPRSRYTDPAFARREVEAVWRRTWQMACREEQVPDPGDCVLYEVADVSLLVVRGTDGILRAFHNSCLHRGTQLRTASGVVDELRCPFHGFTWNLDGTFRGMPCPWDFPHVDPVAFSLPEARVATWGGFVFVSVDPTVDDLERYLEILPRHFASWHLDQRRLAAHVMRPVPCNWKVALEAFIEAYHTMAVHPQLLATSGDAQTEYDVYDGVHHVSRMITPVGVASEHVADEVSEQRIAESMFLTRDDPELRLEDGATARPLLADRTRRNLADATGRSFDDLSDSEALDAIEYFVFPNFMPWAGYTTPLVYRFRPGRDDHRTSIMDVMLLEPLPADGSRSPPSPTRVLDADQSWADAPELGYMGRILDQDTATLGRVQRGLESSSGPDVTLAVEQESRIRHFHATLDRYLAR